MDAAAAVSTRDWFFDTITRARLDRAPYPHWFLEDALPPDVARAVPALPIAPPQIDDTLGRRETHNSTRTFFGVEERARYAVADDLARTFQSPQIVGALQRTTGAPIEGGSLRIEYCQDGPGFWLEPHTDIGAKIFTMLVYLSDTPDAADWGTDIYDGDFKHLGRAPGDFNRGLIFIPGQDTWHGVEKRPINGVRKSIIVNYVKPEWRSRHELAFPDEPVSAA